MPTSTPFFSKLSLTACLVLAPAVALAAGNHANSHGSHAAPGHPASGDGHGHGAGHRHGAGHVSTVGKPGDPAKVSRTVTIEMHDTMRFTPGKISVKAGETVRFSVVNKGRMPHELVIGSAVELAEHAEMMRKMPHMDHKEPNMIRLDAGKRGGLVWQFTQAGEFPFACLVPGHFEAGMTGAVAVQ